LPKRTAKIDIPSGIFLTSVSIFIVIVTGFLNFNPAGSSSATFETRLPCAGKPFFLKTVIDISTS